MKILADLTHPAHVHFFRHAITQWRDRHEVLITSRRKDIATDLIETLGWTHLDLGAARSGGGLAWELVSRTAKLLPVVRRFRPDVMVAIGGTWIATSGWLTRTPSVVFYDTENATASNAVTYRLCTAVVTPECYEGWVPEKKHVTYDGYHELAYTHPRRFQPDPTVVADHGLQPGSYIFLRVVSWQASHDLTDHGFTDLEGAVATLEQHAPVVISAEGPLPPSLEDRRYTGPVERIHDLLAFARIYVGESATMASECATLGTPAALISTSRRGYTNEQETRYGLVANFSDRRHGQRQALDWVAEVLSDADAHSRFDREHQRLLEETVDVTDMIDRVTVAATEPQPVDSMRSAVEQCSP